MNATQALSLSVSDKTLYSIGRVQTPTLAMICSRFQEFTEFKPVVYYQLELLGQKEAQLFKALSDRRWEKESEALAALLLVKKESYATILEVEKKEKREPSPLLYDLTSLQQDANRIYGYTAEETLGIAQTLYESKYLTYPRTGSRYIGEDVFLLIPDRIKLFKGVEKYTGTVSFLQSVALNKRSVNDAKVTDHHALLPTENLASELTGRDKDIYEMVVSRMMEAFHQTCIKEVVKVSIRAGELFSANGTTITYAGWRGVQNLQEKEDTESEATELPLFEKGDKVIVQEVVSVEKRTKPKPLHSEATLLKAMETCGSDIEDDSVRELMKESGLGTPATRAAIIEVLIAREYVIRKKKTLVPTEKGLSVYRLVKDKEIAMPEMTGGWEKKFALIERGEMKASSFAVQIKEYAKEITVQLLGSGKDIRAHQAEKGDDKVHCPKCKVGEISHVNNSKLYAWVCSEREACGFILYGEIAGKKLSEAQGKMLILNKRSKLIKGFKSVKTGKLFDAVLCIGDDFKVRFDFGK
jgi:DNA topoisomerase-3